MDVKLGQEKLYTKFQLGHVFSDMDSAETKREWITLGMFQLGHVFSDMDSYKTTEKGLKLLESFNWATSFQTWIDKILKIIYFHPTCFNWATSFQTWIERPFFGL